MILLFYLELWWVHCESPGLKCYFDFDLFKKYHTNRIKSPATLFAFAPRLKFHYSGLTKSHPLHPKHASVSAS